uniref:E2 ubiquitin-conjugating enzyme n=1 Tax=Anthurium amnicola TaxID=1678845 RepID=A0A1D1YSV4_9ARAE
MIFNEFPGSPPHDNPDASTVINGSSVQTAGFVLDWQLQKEDDMIKDIADLDAQYASESEFTYFSDDEFYNDDDKIEGFDKETSSDGDSALAAEFASMVGLPKELQLGEPGASRQEDAVTETETQKKFEQFDVVQDYSGHHFSNSEIQARSSRGKNKITKLLSKLHILNNSEKKHQELTGPRREWVRRIQQEWKVLEKDLPEGIFVRVYEERIDLLRAVIIGSSGTPYHDGLFFFDVCFPFNYPDAPPLVYYHAHGLRLNPNLYATGRVCLSLLGTWHGRGCERWNPKSSTLLQLLLSLQAIVLNPQPYFNEPGYSRFRGTSSGDQQSLFYNQNAFLLSCKTMLYTLRQPPKHFEAMVTSHFRRWGRAVLLACSAYMEGVKVGSEVLDGGQGRGVPSASFVSSLKSYFNTLLGEFKARGADCEGLTAYDIN